MKWAVVAVLVLALAGAAAADVVVLTNGQVLQGNIKQADNMRVLMTVGGRDYIIASDQVARMQYGDAVAPAAAPYWQDGMYPFWGVGMLYPAPRRVIVTAARANIRRGPGTEYGLVTEVVRDMMLVAVGESDEWFRLALPDGSQAWMNKSLGRALQQPQPYPYASWQGWGWNNSNSYQYDPYLTNIAAPVAPVAPAYAAPVAPVAPAPYLGAAPMAPVAAPGVLPQDYRQAQIEQLSHQVRLSLSAAEIAELVKYLQR